MSELLGIDFAWSKPTPQQVITLGARWVAGYLSPDPTKNLTRPLVDTYQSLGLSVVVVWESTGGRATQGRAAGIADASSAYAQHAGLGLPVGPIYFAVDEDVAWDQVASYFEGVMSVLGVSCTGVYGAVAVIEGAHGAGIPYLWQTVAWSGGTWAPYATIRQPGGTVLAGTADTDEAETADFGQYPRPTEDDMPLTTTDAKLVATTLLETSLPDVGNSGTRTIGAWFEYLDEHNEQRAAQIAALAAQVVALTALVEKLCPTQVAAAQAAKSA